MFLKKTPLSILFIFFVVIGFAQESSIGGVFNRSIVSLSYGVGSASWYSNFENSILYDKDGTALKAGNLKFSAKNPLSSYNLEVLMPIASIRLGLGISFERFNLDKIELSNQDQEGSFLIFDESFRFDKFFILGEVPLFTGKNENFSVAASGKLGYYNYTGVQRFNLFGEEPIAQTYLFGLGGVADYKVFNKVYLFLSPQAELKLFNNSSKESPSEVKHKIISYIINFGIRFDVSR